jgi:hypothetical protein
MLLTIIKIKRNDSPTDQAIPFHHEMVQQPKFPSNLLFFCDIPPEQGGETPLCFSNEVYEKMNSETPEFVKKLVKKGIMYTGIFPIKNGKV